MTGLVPFAILAATVYALRGATVVGDNVLAAPVDPVKTLSKPEGARPVIGIYTGDEVAMTSGRLLLEGQRRLDIVFQIFLPESVSVDVNGTPVALDTAGIGAEVVFAAIWRQACRALQAQDSPWSKLWNRFVNGVHEVHSQDFLFELPGNARSFAREVVMVCETADEPEYGCDPYPFWAEFIAALRELPAYGDAVADLIAAEISAQPGLPSWRLLAASQGESPEGAQALGYAPFTPDGSLPEGEAPGLASVDLDQVPFDADGG